MDPQALGGSGIMQRLVFEFQELLTALTRCCGRIWNSEVNGPNLVSCSDIPHVKSWLCTKNLFLVHSRRREDHMEFGRSGLE